MSLSQLTPQSIEIVPLTLHIGAEIRGVDLAKSLPPQQVKEVRDAFLKWKVVFFRNQHLDHAQHIAMARQFGEPTTVTPCSAISTTIPKSIRSPRTGSRTKTARRKW
jgi:alpha-ketoglutarate-dependent taurine dioxygenase